MSNYLEGQIFDWSDGWDELDTAVLLFYTVVLRVPVGKFEAGTKFASAIMDCQKSMLVLIEKDETEHKFRLNLTVGEEIK